MRNWPFDPLNPYAYDFIMIDPPWRLESFSDKGKTKHPEKHYKTMPIHEIRALPVGDLASPNAVLWCWGTNPMIDQQIDCVKHWGFKFVTLGTWGKLTKHGKVAFGTGYRLRGSSEPFIIATIGRPDTSKSIRSLIMAKMREHSRKPEEAYVEAEKMMPGARRADVFSRQVRPGWTNWGDESEMFEA